MALSTIVTALTPNAILSKINEIINSHNTLLTNHANLSGLTETAKTVIRKTVQTSGADSIYQNHFHCTDTNIVLKDGASSYGIEIKANSTISFDTNQLTEPAVMRTYEVLVVMQKVYSITFEGVKWLDNNTPDLSEAGTYLFAFRYYPSGYFVGNLQGRFY